MKLIPLILSILVFISKSSSQTFVDVASENGINHFYSGGEYGGGCSFHDFNRDGKEDISLPSGNGLSKFYIYTNGEFIEVGIAAFSGSVKSFIWVDYDNDGDADLSYTVYDGTFHLLKNQGNLSFIEIDLDIEANIEATNYGISWADYDNDGFLDFYVGRYVTDLDVDPLSQNRLIKNNGDDTFSDVTDEAGVGNYGTPSFIGSWFDYNGDGLIDLHVINDKLWASNTLFKNNGNGTFTNITIEIGANVNIDCMSNTVGDYDNDGDFDLYLSNGEQGNHILKASGTQGFQDIFPSSGAEMYQVCWGANWLDYDHNGWKDLYVCSEEVQSNNGFFINNFGVNFDRIDDTFPLEPKRSYSSVKGDINDDGLYDLLVLNSAPDSSSLFLNEFEDSYNYISLELTGTYSNRDAIGTRIDYYVDGNRYTEHTHAGTDYMSQDSQFKLLSIPNDYAVMDSILITWPRGLKEKYYSIGTGSKLNPIEGSTLSYNLANYPLSSICPGDSTSVEIIAECDSIIWSSGINNSSLIISEPGTYSAIIYFEGYELESESFVVGLSPSPIVDSISVTPPLCFGENTGLAIVHSSSSLTNELLDPVLIDSLIAGDHYPTIEISGHCAIGTNFQLSQPSEMFTISTTLDVLCYGDSSGSVSFLSFGGTGTTSTILNTPDDLQSLSSGTYEYVTIDENSCTYNGMFEVGQPDTLLVELIATDATESNLGSLTFTIIGGIEPFSLSLNDESILNQEITELNPGEYCLTVEDANGCSSVICGIIDLTINLLEHNSNELSIHPNPSNDIVYIRGIPSSAEQIYLINSLGQEVFFLDHVGSELILDCSTFDPGVYYLRCNADNKILLQRKISIN